MEPLTIAGALMGAFLNKLLPEILLTVLLVVLLSFTAHKTLTKAFKLYKVETELINQRNSTPESDAESADSLTEALLEVAEPEDEEQERMKENGERYTAEENKELENLVETERKVPLDKLAILVVMFFVVLVINLLKGGGAFPSPVGITCGSEAFWLANATMLLWILVIVTFIRALLIKQWETKKRLGFNFVDGDIEWDPKATWVYPSICSLAGFFAGMFGVGGGIVKGPLMLAMGVHPAVSSATSACMILFTSFTATTSFVVFGLLVMDYAVACFIIGFVATWVGQVALNVIMKKNERNSYIAFSIGGVVALSSVLMTIQSVLSIVEGKEGANAGICGVSG